MDKFMGGTEHHHCYAQCGVEPMVGVVAITPYMAKTHVPCAPHDIVTGKRHYVIATARPTILLSTCTLTMRIGWHQTIARPSF